MARILEKSKEMYDYINGEEHRPVTASTNGVISTIQINSNIAVFVLSMTMQRVNTTTTGTIQFVATGNFNAPPLLVYWADAVGTFWFNKQQSTNGMPVDSLYGDGRLPHYLKQPLELGPNAQFQVVVSNLLGSSLYAYLTHSGYHIFASGGQA